MGLSTRSLLLIYISILASLKTQQPCLSLTFFTRQDPLSRMPTIEEPITLQPPLTARKEVQGNITFECTPSGPCLPCSYTEKGDDEKYHCSATGYRQSNKCIEVQAALSDDNSSQEQGDKDASLNEGTKMALDVDTQLADLEQKEHTNSENQAGGEGRSAFKVEDGRRVYHKFVTCLPSDDIERLSVLGFEGIIFGLLIVSASFILYRRRHNYSPSGMTRVPSNARF